MRIALILAAAAGLFAPQATVPEPRLVRDVSTADSSEIRLAFSSDGRFRLWGRIGPSDTRLRIVMSVRDRAGKWSVPAEVSFSSAGNDFDPSFAPDGKSLLFFSNRPGGVGKSDLWQVPFDAATGRFGEPVNLGAQVNSPGEEFAPSLSADGRTLLFASDGHGGFGRLDLFVARRGKDGGWGKPVNLGAGVNGPLDDFDATFVGRSGLVFTSGDNEEGPIFLYSAMLKRGAYLGKTKLPLPFNCGDKLNLGPSVNPREPGLLYFSARCVGLGAGRSDIFSAAYPVR